MGNKVSSESGFPSSYDYASVGPEETSKMHITTPAGMTDTALSARVNPHQNYDETKPVGMTGTTYSPDREDKIIRSSGGHMIIMGNSPGNETFRVQNGKSGALIEFDSEGRTLIHGPKGLHMSMGGDGQIVVHGDIHMVAGGDFRVKCSDFIVDCHNYTVHADNNHITDVYGSHNLHVNGDSHSTVHNDKSSTVGGNHRTTVAGDMMSQTSGDVSHASKGSTDHSSVGAMSHSTQAGLTSTAAGDHTMNAKGKTNMNTEGDMAFTGNGKMAMNSQGDASFKSKGSTTTAGDSGMSVGSSGGGVSVAAKTALGLSGGGSISKTSPSISASSNISQPSTGGAGGGTPGSSAKADDTKADVKKPEVKVAEAKQVLDIVGDYVATDGQIDKIYSSSQLEHAYNTEEGGQIPDKVMARAKKIGAVDQNYQPAQGETIADSGGSGNPIGMPGSTFNTEVS